MHDPNFAERLRALKAANKLTAMECSILATGRAKPGTIEGKQANVVEAITAAHAVDWVTRAGAGGQAIDILESAAGATDLSADKPTEEVPAVPTTPVDAGQVPTEEKPAADPVVDAAAPAEPDAPADAPKTDETTAQPATDETPATTDVPGDATLADSLESRGNARG